jgi:phosphate transport system permease protein
MSGATAVTTMAAPAPRDPARQRRKLPLAGSDGVYWAALYGVGLVFVGVCGAFLYSTIDNSLPAWRHSGLGLIFGTTWNPNANQYGALPLIAGTLETSFIALLFAVPIGILCAVTMVHLVPRRLRTPLSSFVELLAAIPSVVYGMVGALVLVAWFQSSLAPWLQSVTHNFPLFSGQSSGFCTLLAGLVLFVMVLPTVAAFSRDAIASVSHEQVEGALSVGATKWQTIFRVVLPSARAGITGAVTLAAARALGETIAVAMVIGNSTTYSGSILKTGGTMAATIAVSWDGASALNISALFALGVILIAITASINAAGRQMLRRSQVGVTL